MNSIKKISGNPVFCPSRGRATATFETGGGPAHGGPEPEGEGSGQGRTCERSARFYAMGRIRLRRHDVIATNSNPHLTRNLPCSYRASSTKCNEKKCKEK